ncbi:MAG TPA: SUMF1/EgtB/PvdO family nonheme iron enzyme [Saprospiraceae bacterium]|nr:SUMF1/EgtB/PvdO family nonheme iron enzyme [Saprospiraceae bacterium]
MRKTILLLGFFSASHSFYLNAQSPQDIRKSINDRVIAPYIRYLNDLFQDERWDRNPRLVDFNQLFENGSETIVFRDFIDESARIPKFLSIKNYLREANRIWREDPNASFEFGEHYFCREGEVYSVTLKKTIRGEAIRNDKKDYIEVNGWVKFKITKDFKIISITESEEPPLDVDGDFVINDWERRCDICPKEKGLWDFDGCKDSDGDGISDDIDNCPELRGSKQYDGCPNAPLVGETPLVRTGKDIALFFAVSNYDQWDDLRNPVTEAEAIAKDLRELYDFQTEVVRDPAKAEIQAKIEEYRKKTYAADAQLFIFFTGHGEYLESTREGFFIPKDAKRNDASQDSYLSYLRLQRWIETLPCRHILLAIDACFSGTFDDDIALKGDPGKRPDQGDWREQYIRQSLQYRSRLFMASGGKVRTPDKSAFTEQFLNALRSFGGDDQLVSFTELWGYVQRASPKPCAAKFGDHEAGGDFLFVLKNDVKNSEANTDLAHWNAAKAANAIESYEAYLKKHPSGDFAEASAGKITALRAAAPNSKPATPNTTRTPENSSVAADGLVFVKGGTFTMGCTNKKDSDCLSNEEPTHKVTLSDFYIGQYEVTQAEWRKVMGNDPPELHNNGCDQCPVEGASWNDIQEFLEKLNKMLPAGQKPFRLPTEAEWEYAARGGSLSKGYKYSGSNNIGDVAWYSENYKTANTFGAQKTTRPVGTKASNELGLFDMSGNVFEWCSDWYSDYSASTQINPTGPSSGFDRVNRGGSWYGFASYCHVTDRKTSKPDERRRYVGFRLARSK